LFERRRHLPGDPSESATGVSESTVEESRDWVRLVVDTPKENHGGDGLRVSDGTRPDYYLDTRRGKRVELHADASVERKIVSCPRPSTRRTAVPARALSPRSPWASR
jgi:hypothetical protein